MGLEAYILQVKFKEPFPIFEAGQLLEDCGAKPVTTSAQTDFELRDNRGLTEVQLQVSNQGMVNLLYLRFSILSPHTVIDQAFEFLINLSNTKAIRLFDTHLKLKELPIDPAVFKQNPNKVKRRQTIISNKTGLVIASGQATTDYIHEHHLEEMYRID